MHKATFFPIGNADTCRIDLSGGQKLLFDFADMCNADDPNDKRIDLAKALKDNLTAARRNHYEVVAFTHLDNDHTRGASSFFHLLHAQKYQSEGRVTIDTLWVPAAVILDDNCDTEDQIAIQNEARYRLKKKVGIRVFSRPQLLEGWLKNQGMSLADVNHLITDAGQVIPGWTKAGEGVEFFVHSPFASRMDTGEVVDRNNDALFLQATFLTDRTESTLILSADVDSDVIEDIVRITRDVKKRPERLAWDLNNVPHHSSYRSLNKDDKGTDKTKPSERVDWLYKQGGRGGYLVSTSNSIPADDKSDQPPHRQAARYYEERAAAISGEYRITMNYPTVYRPEEMVFEIGVLGIRLVKRSSATGSASIIGSAAPRAGSK